MLLRGLSRTERRIGWASWLAHWISSFALLWLMMEYYEGVGDVLSFFRVGAMIQAYASFESSAGWGRVLELLVQRQVDFPFMVHGVGRSTGTMTALAAITLQACGGSIWAANGVAAMLAFSGKVALLRFFRDRLPERVHLHVAIATLLVPSVVFWTSGLVKEAIAITGLGWAVFGIGHAQRRRWRSLLGFTIAASGVWVVSLTKTYLLVPLGASVGVWLTWRAPKKGRTGSALRLIAGIVVAYVLVVAVGQFFPRYSLEQIGDEIAEMQSRGIRAGGGSFVEVGDPRARSLGQQLLFAPLGLLSVLFRPFVFEVRNATMLVNALETTLFLILLLRMLFRAGPRYLWRTLRESEMLMMCITFVTIAGIGVGLSTTNLGTLSRYRVPTIPMYVLTVFVIHGLLAPHMRRASAVPAQPHARPPAIPRRP